MTDSNGETAKEGTKPGEPLNAEQIKPLDSGTPVMTPSAVTEDRFSELSWTLIGGLGPFVVALVVHGAITGWSSSTVDPSNLAFCLFALTLAAFVRIISHGSGKRFLGLLLLAGILQIAFALYFSGTFSSALPAKSEVAKIRSSMDNERLVRRPQLTLISNVMAAFAEEERVPSSTVYICLATTGMLSTATLMRYWSPRVRERTLG